MLSPWGILQLLAAWVLAPLLLSIINHTKAVLAGRHGQPWLQPYWELWKLLHKGAVYSHTTTVVFVAGPIVGCAATALALLFVPLGGVPALVSYPVDDPNTHLELTMIHEVMVLDHRGPDFALIQYAASLKMWLLGCLLVGTLVPLRTGSVVLDMLVSRVGLGALAVGVGAVESIMARLRLVRVPQFLIAASILAIVALFLVAR